MNDSQKTDEQCKSRWSGKAKRTPDLSGGDEVKKRLRETAQWREATSGKRGVKGM